MSLDAKAIHLTGDEPGNNFTMAFGGEPGLAARRVGKFLGLLRSSTGWRELQVQTPVATYCKAYFDCDKNRRQARQELIGRR